MKFDEIEALVPHRRVKFPDGLKSDDIEEARPSQGVTIDGVLLKDGSPGVALKGAAFGNTLRMIYVTVTGSGATDITCKIEDESFNEGGADKSVSDAFGKNGNDEVGTGETAVTYSLNNDGTELKIDLPHDVAHVLAVSKLKSEFTTQHTIEAEAVSNDIIVRFVEEPGSGGNKDIITGLATTKVVSFKLVYVELAPDYAGI